MIRVIKISPNRQEEIDRFVDYYTIMSKGNAPSFNKDYFKKAQCYSFYKKKEMIGGFCISIPPLRIMSVLEISEKRKIFKDKDILFGELSFVWMHPDFKRKFRLLMWFSIFTIAALYSLRGKMHAMLFGSKLDKLSSSYEKYGCHLLIERKLDCGNTLKIYQADIKMFLPSLLAVIKSSITQFHLFKLRNKC